MSDKPTITVWYAVDEESEWAVGETREDAIDNYRDCYGESDRALSVFQSTQTVPDDAEVVTDWASEEEDHEEAAAAEPVPQSGA